MTGTSFRFRLERVRALRERREDVAKEELAGAMVAHRLCEEQEQAAADRVAQARTEQRNGGAAPTSAPELLARQAYLERSEQDHLATRRDLHRQELELNHRRQALTVAAMERQALERLKESRRAEHEREVARREGLMLDEMAINGFRRSAA
jgi:flagellar export protein FliJ